MASDGGDWLKGAIGNPTKGKTEWTLVMVTSHFGRDPLLAAASQNLALDLLSEAGSKGDTVKVVWAEMEVWGKPKTVPLEGLAEALPTAPKPGSRGGHDTEHLLAEVAPSAKGPILVVAKGDSQLPIDGSGSLVGGDGTVKGFGGPVRRSIAVNTPKGERSVRVTLLTKDSSFVGDQVRVPVQSTLPVATPTGVKQERESGQGGNRWLWWTVGIGLAGVGGGFLLGQGRRVEAPILSESVPEDLDGWKKEAITVQKRLDLISQDLAESAGALVARDDEEKIGLRQELQRQERALKTWDETAMDFLDGIDRVLDNPALAEGSRKEWQKMRRQFVAFAQRAGLDVISPQAGTPVLEGQHSIEEIVNTPDGGEPGAVCGVILAGYRRGDRVLRLAKVQVTGETR